MLPEMHVFVIRMFCAVGELKQICRFRLFVFRTPNYSPKVFWYAISHLHSFRLRKLTIVRSFYIGENRVL